MEILKPKWVLEVLRRELYLRGISGREIDRRLQQERKETARQALAAGSEGRVSLERLSTLLEAAEIDAHDFLGLVAGNPMSLRSLVGALAGGEPPSFSRREKGILALVEVRRQRGVAGAGENRARLCEIEIRREEDPAAASELAWQAVEESVPIGQPGAVAAALATLAGGASRPQARVIFQEILAIVGDEPPPGLLAAKIFGNLARILRVAGYPKPALRMLRYRAYPDADFHGGDGDDLALLLLETFRAARGAGELDYGIACLVRAIAGSAGEIPRFLARHELAATLLAEGKDPGRASRLYDELVAMPHLAAAPPAVRALARSCRLRAHWAAGRLGPEDLSEFESTWETCREQLGILDRLRFGLDFVAYLRRHGHDEAANQQLIYEFWTMVELDDDVDGLQTRFMDACKESKVALGQWMGVVRRPRTGDSPGRTPFA